MQVESATAEHRSHSKPHQATRTRSETVIVTQNTIGEWRPPPFQRPLTVNKKVEALAEVIKAEGGVIPGVITLGKIRGETYLLDGQHRVRAFLMSGHEEGYADLRIHEFENMGQMGQEFVNLNCKLVALRPDDVLRGLEGSSEALRGIRKRCPFVGYDRVRRGADNSPFVSMSVLLKCWSMSQGNTPGGGFHGSSIDLVQHLTLYDASTISDIACLLDSAWGREVQYAKLWKSLNLTMCMWLYRKMVLEVGERLGQTGRGAKRSSLMSAATFKKAMMEISADATYLDWLVGRLMRDRDRAPCFNRLKAIISRRVLAETKVKVKFPQPEWA